MQIRHNDCGGQVLLDVGKLIVVYAEVATSKDSLVVSRLLLNKAFNKYIKSNYYCMKCNEKDVGQINLIIRCYNCEHWMHFKEICIPSKSNGIYCKSCCKQYFKDETRIGSAQIKIILGRVSD
ncbi:hypothetical protein LCGC14_1318650 [marine sediment metagenome]|uniref:Uncharacterized protein n=1 Tax=marine sediment metagenome TaxID=412755 RepID=A0A0F9NMH2_9ZZZZ